MTTETPKSAQSNVIQFTSPWTETEEICRVPIELNENNKTKFVAQFFLKSTPTCERAQFFKPLDFYLNQWEPLFANGHLKNRISTYLEDKDNQWDSGTKNIIEKPGTSSAPFIELANRYGEVFDTDKFKAVMGQKIVEIVRSKMDEILNAHPNSENGKVVLSAETFYTAKRIENLMIFWLPECNEDRVRLKHFLDQTEILYEVTAATSR